MARTKPLGINTERRIEYIALDDIQVAKRNPKQHKLSDLTDSVNRFGFASPAVMDERTSRLVAGHGRLEVLSKMQAEGATAPDGVLTGTDGRWQMPVLRGWQSRSDAEAEAFLIADNRQSEIGGWDSVQLAEMLGELGDHTGLGYTESELEQLTLLLDPSAITADDPEEEWAGMPEFEQKDTKAWRSLIVHFESQEHLDDFVRLLGMELTDKTRSTWFPQKEQRDTVNRSYE